MPASSPPTGGVPTLRNVDHVAFTVPDLDAAVSFFVEHFRGELVFHDGPFSGRGDEMTRRLNVAPEARCRLAMVRMGRHTNLELFEYEAPERRETPPRNSDVGGHHLALYVDDIDAAHAYVASIPGVVVMDGPNGVAPDSPVAGQRWFYFLTPWGMQMELTSCPGGGFYAGLPGAGMAPPAGSWR
ncbi:VOC family protein [Actinomadura sp. LOL_016]|uniref:VOC family protein n=1 Tax=unclassified Actinomadura TaxID=2626254 RepID=UPI003A807BDC